MIFPEHINKKVAIVGLSGGFKNKEEKFDKSISNLSKYFIVEEVGKLKESSVRADTYINRAKAFNSAYLNDDNDIIMCAKGGNYLFEILPYIDKNVFKKRAKWFLGASDPTSVCLYITTVFDIATFYGLNGGSFDEDQDYIHNGLDIIMGKTNIVKSYDYYQNANDFIKGVKDFNRVVYYKTFNKEINSSGRLIGGCLDVIRNMFSTSYMDLKGFVDKYKDDSIIWYFDIYDMSSLDVYLTLLQMKYMGLFEHSNLVLFGRVLFKKIINDVSYSMAYRKALGNIDIAYDLDIGHTSPKMIMINGAIANVKIKDGRGSIEYFKR